MWRTARSQHCGATAYEPGRTYTAHALSWDCATACHPGIYAGPKSVISKMYPGQPLVRCYVRDGEWTITAKNEHGPVIRCARLRVLAREAALTAGSIAQRSRRITALANQVSQRASDVPSLRMLGEIMQLANENYADAISAQATIESVPVETEAPEVQP